MILLSRLVSLLRNVIDRRRVDDALTQEVRGYLDLLTDEKIAAGMTPEGARRAARIELGGIEQVKEHVRDARTGALLEQCLQDLQYGARVMRRSPGFTCVAVVTLALGIGANTAVFSVVNGVLLRPLPFGAPDSLFSISGMGYTGELVELRGRARTFDVASCSAERQSSLTGRGEPIRLSAATLSASATSLLGVQPVLGRPFSEGDERPGADHTILVSHALWQQRFGGDRALIGSIVRLDGIDRTVVGILPPHFRFPGAATQVWTPLRVNVSDRVTLWSTGGHLIARAKNGAGLDDVRAELRAIGPAMREQFPWHMPADYGQAATAVPLREQMVGEVRPMLLILLAAVGLVLLIACVNVSNLTITRAVARQRELAIRAALGADRSRLVRQVLTESALIGLAGGACGLAIAAVAVRALVAWLPADTPRLSEIALDVRVLEFTTVVAVLSGLLVGALPAFRAAKADLAPRLGTGARTGPGRQAARLSAALVAIEMAVAVPLVIAAVLLARSFWNLSQVAPGFEAERVLSAAVAPPAFRYRDDVARREFYGELLGRLRAMPGVTAAAATDRVPFGGESWGSVFIIEGRPDPATHGGDWPMADVRATISDGYLPALGVPLRAGRAFGPQDTSKSSGVLMVSETLAANYWPGQSAVGKRVRFPADTGWRSVVGVLADIKWQRVDEAGQGAVYTPLSQSSAGTMSIVIRGTGDLNFIRDNLRSTVRSIDRDTPVDNVRTLTQRIAESVQRPRFVTALLAGFAGLGLILGALGIYGSVADMVARRRREIGVRMALGASPEQVLTAVLRRGLLITAAGVAAGVIVAALATRVLGSLLFGVTATDPATFILVPMALGVVGLLSSYVPARRATRVDPLITLRTE